MSCSTSIGFFSAFCLAIWNIPNGLKWLAFFIHKAAVPYGPLAMSWANEICGADAEERAVVLGVMNASGYAVNTWLPLLTYPAIDAPRFKKGFTYSSVAYLAQFGITGLVAWLQMRESRRKATVDGEVEDMGAVE
jgi:MFS transporter, ACS family, pantothenate transporter